RPAAVVAPGGLRGGRGAGPQRGRARRPGATPVTRVGAIDCGTNSIRLLIADVEDGTLTELHREMRIVRLGHGVDATGRIGAEPMARTLAAASDYATACRDSGCESVRFVATSASRDASNAEEVISGDSAAFSHFDVTPEVGSGHDEAALSVAGAR